MAAGGNDLVGSIRKLSGTADSDPDQHQIVIYAPPRGRSSAKALFEFDCKSGTTWGDVDARWKRARRAEILPAGRAKRHDERRVKSWITFGEPGMKGRRPGAGLW